jgi:hypothetical protein
MELSIIDESEKENSVGGVTAIAEKNSNYAFVQEFHKIYEKDREGLSKFKKMFVKQKTFNPHSYHRRKSVDSNYIFHKNRFSILEKPVHHSSLKKPDDLKLRRHSVGVTNKLSLNSSEKRLNRGTMVSFNPKVQYSDKSNKGKFSPVKIYDRRHSVVNSGQTFKIERAGDNIINRSNSLNTNNRNLNALTERTESKKRSLKRVGLTLNKAVQEINKPYISFNRRNSQIGQFTKIFNRLMDKKTAEGGKDLSDSNSILAKSSIKFRTTYFKKRLKIVVMVIGTIAFIKNEIIKFGIVPRSTKPILDEEGLAQMDNTYINMSYFNILKEDKNKMKKLDCFMIHPGNCFIKIWRNFILIFSFVFCLMFPFRISYTDTYFNKKHLNFLILDIIIEIIYFTDILLNCITGYYNNNGKLITSFKKIFLNYLSSLWLIVDIVCMIPILLLITNMQDDYDRSGMLIIYLVLLRVFKTLLKINEIGFVEKTREFLGVNTGIVKVIFFFINTIILSHIFACIWYFNAVCEKFGPDTWVFRYRLVDESIELIYLKSLYFAYVVFITVGYGDIVPYTNSNNFLTKMRLFW